MAKLDLPYQIANLTPADAAPVQANFARVEQYSNAELIERDGSVAMNAQLRLIGNPVNALDAAPKQYVDTIVPIGGVIMYTGTGAPVGGIWLVCDGSSVQSATYPALFAVMGTRFGGSGGFFNLPPLSGRFPVGSSGTIAVGAQGGSANAVVVTHTHDIGHNHGAAMTGNDDTAHTHVGANHAHGISITSDSTGVHHHAVPVAGRGFLVDGASGTEAELQIGGSGYSIAPFTTDDGAHTHAINGASGLADRSLTTTTASTNHRHSATVAAFAGNAANTGVSGTGANMPPYVGLIFIVRAA